MTVPGLQAGVPKSRQVYMRLSDGRSMGQTCLGMELQGGGQLHPFGPVALQVRFYSAAKIHFRNSVPLRGEEGKSLL